MSDRCARYGAVPVLLGIAFVGALSPAAAQSLPERSGIWASGQLGYGSLALSSDQEPRRAQGTFALAFAAGGTVNPHLRLGGEVNGWLLEATNLSDPATGEGVSQALAVAEVFPWSSRGLFLKAGVGRAAYSNSNPGRFDGSGWGQTVGLGCDLPIGRRLAITPNINYSRGNLGNVTNQLATITNRTYGVIDLRIALTSP